MESESNEGLFVTRNSRRTWNVQIILPSLVRFEWVSMGLNGPFQGKKAILEHKMCIFGRAPPDLAPPARVTTGEFLAQNLDWARAPPRLSHG